MKTRTIGLVLEAFGIGLQLGSLGNLSKIWVWMIGMITWSIGVVLFVTSE